MSNKLRVGIAGCGQIARKLHLPAVLRSNKAELTAIYNRRLARCADIAKEHPDVGLYDQYGRFLDESGVQALIICTPNQLHHDMSCAASRRGIHVLVEKPMALSLAEAKSMIDTAGNHEAVLMIAQSQRYVPSYRKARELIRGGLLGRVHQFSCSFAHSGPLAWSPGGKWFTDPELGGPGVVFDLGIHKVDALRYLTGREITRVGAFQPGSGSRESVRNAVAILELDNGSCGTLLASWSTQGKYLDDFLLLGENGSLLVEMERDAALVFYPVRGERIVYDVPRGIPVRDGAWLLEETEEFIECALGERDNPVPGEEGCRALEICLAIDRSARTRRFVELPLR